MALNKFKLGDLIELCDERNTLGEFTLEQVRGISTDKNFIVTKANMDGVSLTSYKLVKPFIFVYVADTSRRGDKIALALNSSQKTLLVSSIYTAFSIKDVDLMMPEYLFMYFNRPEFDRYSRFNSWGSARETFSWNDFCDIDILLPSLEIQKKYVALYQAACDNLKAYESRLDSLKLVCDGYIDKLEKSTKVEKIGKYISLCSETNIDGKYTVDDVRGISVDKTFIETKANMQGVSLLTYKLVKPREFAYVADTSRRGDKIALALNTSNSTLLVSSIYTVFCVNDVDILLSDYLAMFFHRPEFDRYARYCSWGSARETFDWEEMCDVEIPIPSIGIQRDIVNIYQCYLERKQIADQMREKIKNLCPVLIRGSLQE